MLWSRENSECFPETWSQIEDGEEVEKKKTGRGKRRGRERGEGGEGMEEVGEEEGKGGGRRVEEEGEEDGEEDGEEGMKRKGAGPTVCFHSRLLVRTPGVCGLPNGKLVLEAILQAQTSPTFHFHKGEKHISLLLQYFCNEKLKGRY